VLSNRSRAHIKLAIRVAQNTTHDNRYHFGAVLARKGRVINVGWNQCRTHPQSKTRYNWIHCEQKLLLGISGRNLAASDIFIARMGYNCRSQMMMAKPCKRCQAIILEAGIRKVYYTIGPGQIGVWNVKRDKWSIINGP
jgi:deoxycytidylate deaminase